MGHGEGAVSVNRTIRGGNGPAEQRADKEEQRMSEHAHAHDSLTAEMGQPLIGVLVEADGRHFVRYFTNEAAAAAARSEQTLQAALGVIGAWSDLDWEELAADLDRIRHESPPTPPIEL
jgi:hypothetical protein